MFVFPEDKPIIRGIRSVYVKIPSLIKHYLEQIVAGCIHFQSKEAEAVLFFTDKSMFNGFFNGPDQVLTGEPAIDLISQSSSPYDFTIDVFEILPEQISLWAGIQTAEAIHTNLSTEFTDLKKLLLKMTGENLTGHIDVTLSSNNESGRIFLANGKFIGGTYSWINNRLSRNKDHIEELISKAKASEGVFNVSSVPLPEKDEIQKEITPTKIGLTPETLNALEDLLAFSEKIIAADKKIKSDFHTLLNKKFVQKVDKYAFLDPFAGEFEYKSGKITFRGDADEKLLASGLIFSIRSLMDDCHLLQAFDEKLKQWQEKYENELLR